MKKLTIDEFMAGLEMWAAQAPLPLAIHPQQMADLVESFRHHPRTTYRVEPTPSPKRNRAQRRAAKREAS